MRKTMDEQTPVGSGEGDCMQRDTDAVAVIDAAGVQNHVTNYTDISVM